MGAALGRVNWAGVAAAAAALLAVVGLLAREPGALGMPLVPIGLGWFVAAGILGLRSSG